MLKKTTLLITGFIFVTQLQAQDLGPNDASKEFPFGRPNSAAPNEIKDYEKLIGLCDCTTIRRNPDQSWGDTTSMVWEWKYILNGTAVQDISYKGDGSASSSIRQYNSDSTAWYVTFFSNNVVSPIQRTWKGGTEENGNIVLFLPQKAPNGMDGFSRLTFQNITDEGFEWRGEWIDSSDQFKMLFWSIDCKKRH